MSSNIKRNKLISIITVLIISITSIISYILCIDYEKFNVQYQQTRKNTKEQLDEYIISIIENNNDALKSVLKSTTEYIHNKIIEEYKGEEQLLERDIINPTINSKLVSILDSELDESYFLTNKDNRKIFVANKDNIIWYRSKSRTTKREGTSLLTWDDIISHYYNKDLSEFSINYIKKCDINSYDIIFWQSNKSSLEVNEANLELLVSELSKNNYDLDELKSFELLVPVYITDTGDIFGTDDVNSLGQLSNNYKIFLVQRVNMYKLVSSHESTIKNYINEIENIDKILVDSKRDLTQIMLIIVVFMVFIIIVSGVIQNKAKSK